jgi:DNA-binding NtrC family response regulator
MARSAPFRIVVADDDAVHRTLLAHPLRQSGWEVMEAGDGEAALEVVRRTAPDVLLLDLRMPGVDGLEVLRRLASEPDAPEVLVVTGDATAESAVAALRLGARDYLTKPWSRDTLVARVRNVGERRRLAVDVDRHRARAALESAAPEFITRDPVLRRRLAAAQGAAQSGVPILLVGESGTGRELLARRIHAVSSVRDGPFVAVSCLGSAEAVEEELFGLNDGGVEGEAGRMGFLELAEGGTLLLTDVEELAAELQPRLMRLLADGVFRRAGGGPPRRATLRVIATSGRPLAAAVASGRVRADLLHRLATVSVELPPLRERRADVALLADHFLKTLPAGGPERELSRAAIRRLQSHPWPGNVRELRNVIERTALLVPDRVVEADALALGDSRPARATMPERKEKDSLVSLPELERRHIRHVLEATGWHRGQAAEVLGIAPKTLYRKVREYGLVPP